MPGREGGREREGKQRLLVNKSDLNQEQFVGNVSVISTRTTPNPSHKRISKGTGTVLIKIIHSLPTGWTWATSWYTLAATGVLRRWIDECPHKGVALNNGTCT